MASPSRLKRELGDLEDKITRLLRQVESGSHDPEEIARQLRRMRSDLEDIQRLARRIASSITH
jgi:polyhydroxyalkanoate synthesis regulator phasin